MSHHDASYRLSCGPSWPRCSHHGPKMAQHEPSELKTGHRHVQFSYKSCRISYFFGKSTFWLFPPLGPPPWHLSGLLGSLWAPLGSSLVHPGPFWASLGVILGSPWVPWNLFGDQLDRLCPPFGAPGRSPRSSWIHLGHFETPWLHLYLSKNDFGAMLVPNLDHVSSQIAQAASTLIHFDPSAFNWAGRTPEVITVYDGTPGCNGVLSCTARI